MLALDARREGDRLLRQCLGQDVSLLHVPEIGEVEEDSVLRWEGQGRLRVHGLGTPAVPHNPYRDAFAHPVGTFLRPTPVRSPFVLALPMQSSPQDFESLFDADTKAAISSGLCIQCRGAKLLCGKTRCPILVRWDSMMKTAPMIDRFDLDGSSPPGVFVGRFGYPKVFVGPLVPPVHGDTRILAAPEEWVGNSMEDIVRFRSTLVRGMHRVHVLDVDRGGRIVDLTRELALGTNPADVEVGFERKPRGRVVLDDNVQPFGPSAPLRRLDIGTLHIDQNLDRATSDTDLCAKDAVLDMYGRGLPVSKIQRAFSVGAFGSEKNRRFVPTRWSITALFF